MTVEEVQEIVKAQSSSSLALSNDHGISLREALTVRPERISIIARMVNGGRVKDHTLIVWLVGKEGRADGYKIIMREDGIQFGLASSGFPADKYPVLDGWYGDLVSAFMSM